MKTLTEHNEEAMKAWKIKNNPSGTGISCPNCSKELVNPSPNITLASYPPQINVTCLNCNYTGYAVA